MELEIFASFPKKIIFIVFYVFFMGSIIDKQEKWLRNLVPHPICFQCDEEFVKFHHLVMDCKERGVYAMTSKSEIGSFFQGQGLLETAIFLDPLSYSYGLKNH